MWFKISSLVHFTCRWSSPPSFSRSALCWRCTQTSCPIRISLWPSQTAAVRRTAWSGLWSTTSPPSTRAAKAPLPKNPTTPSLARPSTAPGRCPRDQTPPRSLHREAPTPLLPARTPTKCALWRSRFPIIPLCLVSTPNARRGGCVWTHMCGPRANSWACPLGYRWWGKVRQHNLKKNCVLRGWQQEWKHELFLHIEHM